MQDNEFWWAKTKFSRGEWEVIKADDDFEVNGRIHIFGMSGWYTITECVLELGAKIEVPDG